MTNPVRMERPVNSTFNILAPDSVRVPGFAIPGPLTPPPNPDYRFRPALLSDLLCWHKGLAQGQHHDGLWLTGPMGSGKSSVVVEIAARLKAYREGRLPTVPWEEVKRDIEARLRECK